MTRAVLGDAIALVRGDRFYTTDFTRSYFNNHLLLSLMFITSLSASNLTTWGFQDCARDPHNGGLGGESKSLPFSFQKIVSC